jgi:hypothetical protein
MNKRIYLSALAMVLFSLPFFAAGKGYGLGFCTGLAASLVSFYLLGRSIPGVGGRVPTKSGVIIMLGARGFVAFLILCAGAGAGAYIPPMAAGITCGLVVHVYMALAPRPVS